MAKNKSAAQKKYARQKAATRRSESPAASGESPNGSPAEPPAPEPQPDPPRSAASGQALMSLESWNDARYVHWRDPESREPEPNGIACPTCAEELSDRPYPGSFVLGNPPRVEVFCAADGCEYRGRRIA